MGKMKVTTGNIARMVESTLETGNKLVTGLLYHFISLLYPHLPILETNREKTSLLLWRLEPII